jgi:hypothetical protein
MSTASLPGALTRIRAIRAAAGLLGALFLAATAVVEPSRGSGTTPCPTRTFDTRRTIHSGKAAVDYQRLGRDLRRSSWEVGLPSNGGAWALATPA